MKSTILMPLRHAQILKTAREIASDFLEQEGGFPMQVVIFGVGTMVCLEGVFSEGEGGAVEKDDFATVIRATAQLEQAHAIAYLSEGWAGSPGWGGAPSADPNRTEVVVIGVETHEGSSRVVHQISRASDSQATLGRETSRHFEDISERTFNARFACLLPTPDELRDDDRTELARAYLSIVQPLNCSAQGGAGTIH
ncbi:hypothetical protein ACO2Q0_01660 [Phenylobacterium sp. VNQ135]|uniref:hypothetical protein n=1 Tax=Phenylobacterium sp. VNQ135 TaxID=3400922 RepID=UPI003C1266AB